MVLSPPSMTLDSRPDAADQRAKDLQPKSLSLNLVISALLPETNCR
jgi:hypothetical protein